jgi:hypothetical protein
MTSHVRLLEKQSSSRIRGAQRGLQLTTEQVDGPEKSQTDLGISNASIAVKMFYATLLTAFVMTAAAPDARAGVVLITPDEAQLPTPKGVFAPRAITRGPRIELSDSDNGELHSPLRLQLKFRGFGGASINLDSLHVTYLKQPNVDLTSRLRPYAQSTGIEIPDAEAPPGQHFIRIEIQDSEGRRTATTFLLNVSP